MAFQAVPNTAEIVVRMTADSQEILNTFHFRNTTGWTEDELQQLADGTKLIWDENFIPLLPSTLKSIKVDAYDLRVAVGLYAEASWAAPASGGDNNDPMPNSVTLAVKESTGFRGRSFRGRNYWPLTPRPAITQNTYSNTYLASIKAAYSLFVGDSAVAADWTLVVVSRIGGGVPRSTAITNIVTGYSVVDPIVDSQRRRLPKRGS